METKEEDFVSDLFIANTHDYIVFFTDRGKVYWLKVYEIPTADRQARGTAIVNLLQLEQGEKINAYIPISMFDDKHYLLMVTKKGTTKKTALSEFSNPRKTGIIAISLDDGDKLVSVKLTEFEEYRTSNRGGQGVITIDVNVRNGNVVDIRTVHEDDEIMVTTSNGIVIRVPVSGIRVQGRNTQGVTIMDIKEKDRVVGVATLAKEESGEEKKLEEVSEKQGE